MYLENERKKDKRTEYVLKHKRENQRERNREIEGGYVSSMSCPRDSSGTNTILCRFVRTNTHERANERRNDSIYHSQVLHPSRPIHVISKDRPSVATRQD